VEEVPGRRGEMRSPEEVEQKEKEGRRKKNEKEGQQRRKREGAWMK
jgi:hypothetical protein